MPELPKMVVRDLDRMEIIMDLQMYTEQQIQTSRPSNNDVVAYKRLALVKQDAEFRALRNTIYLYRSIYRASPYYIYISWENILYRS